MCKIGVFGKMDVKGIMSRDSRDRYSRAAPKQEPVPDSSDDSDDSSDDSSDSSEEDYVHLFMDFDCVCGDYYNCHCYDEEIAAYKHWKKYERDAELESEIKEEKRAKNRVNDRSKRIRKMAELEKRTNNRGPWREKKHAESRARDKAWRTIKRLRKYTWRCPYCSKQINRKSYYNKYNCWCHDNYRYNSNTELHHLEMGPICKVHQVEYTFYPIDSVGRCGHPYGNGFHCDLCVENKLEKAKLGKKKYRANKKAMAKLCT